MANTNEQYIPDVSEQDIERIILRDYRADQTSEIQDLISKLELREKNRIVAACLKVAKGNLDSLRRQLDDAPGYWREILSDAEYPNYSEKWSKINKLSSEEKSKIIEKDKNQYIQWFNRK